MTHEPECACAAGSCCPWMGDCDCQCDCDRLRKAYTRGYNAHAAAAQHWQDTHGAYRQHGEGLENP